MEVIASPNRSSRQSKPCPFDCKAATLHVFAEYAEGFFVHGTVTVCCHNATNIAVFSLATKTSWKNDAGTWESRTEWRCVAFGNLADFACNLAKGAHVAVEEELRCREYQREVAVGNQKTSIP